MAYALALLVLVILPFRVWADSSATLHIPPAPLIPVSLVEGKTIQRYATVTSIDFIPNPRATYLSTRTPRQKEDFPPITPSQTKNKVNGYKNVTGVKIAIDLSKKTNDQHPASTALSGAFFVRTTEDLLDDSKDIMKNFAYSGEYDWHKHGCTILNGKEAINFIFSGKLVLDGYLIGGEISLIQYYFSNHVCDMDITIAGHNVWALGASDGFYTSRDNHQVNVCSPNGNAYTILNHSNKKNEFVVYRLADHRCDALPKEELSQYRYH